MNNKYFNRGNNHWFIQADADDLEKIKIICMKPNQRIHMIELYPPALGDMFEVVIDIASENKNKVIIHIPKVVRDYERWLRNKLDLTGKRCSIVIEPSPFRFTVDKDHMVELVLCKGTDDLIDGYYHLTNECRGSYHIEQRLISRVHLYSLPISVYKHSAVFGSMVSYNNPELFKDRIIRNFRKNCPKAIINSTFNNSDEEIWDYIKGEQEFKENNKKKVEDEDCDYDIKD